MSTETRIVNEKTGGEKGAKPEAMSLLPLDVLMRHVAPHYAKGAEKYARDNWRRGYDWHLSADALLRHFAAFWADGEANDEETGTRHLAAVVFHALALLYFMDAHPDLDDRSAIARERAAADESKARLDAQLDEAREHIGAVVAELIEAEGIPTGVDPAPSWDELEEEPLTGPCPLRELNPDGCCSMADRFPGGHAECVRSCKAASS